MKVAFVCSNIRSKKLGDAASNIFLAEALTTQGLKVNTVFIDDVGFPRSTVMSKTLFPIKISKMINVFLKYDILDISYGDGWFLFWLIRLLSRILSLKERPLLVSRAHSLEYELHRRNIIEAKNGNIKLSWKYPIYHGGYRLLEERLGILLSDLSLFFNLDDAKSAIKNLSLNPEKVEVIKNGIPSYLIGLPKRHLAYNPISIGVAVIGSYINGKGIAYTVPAINKILLKNRNVRALFIGTGVSQERVIQDIDPSILNRVEIVPEYDRKDLPRLLDKYQIVIFGTLAEAFGMSLVEAMACGLAPVATRVGGPKSIIKDGVSGLLVPPRDTQAIVNAVEKLINNHDLLNTIRAGAYTRAQEFEWEIVAKENIEIYEKHLRKLRQSK